MNLKELGAPLQSVLFCSKYSSCDLDQETKTTHMRYLYQWSFDVSGCSCLPQVQDVKHFKRVCLHCVQRLPDVPRVRHKLLFCSLAISIVYSSWHCNVCLFLFELPDVTIASFFPPLGGFPHRALCGTNEVLVSLTAGICLRYT